MVSLIKQYKAFRTAVLPIIFLFVFPFGYIARFPMLSLFDTVLDLYNYITDKGALTRFLSLLSRNNKKSFCVCVCVCVFFFFFVCNFVSDVCFFLFVFFKILTTYDNGSAVTIIAIR